MTALFETAVSLLFLYSSLINFSQTWSTLPLMAKILPIVITLLCIFVILLIACPFSYSAKRRKLYKPWYRNALDSENVISNVEEDRLSSVPVAPPLPEPPPPKLEPPPPDYSDHVYTTSTLATEVPERRKRVNFDEMGRAMSVGTSVTCCDTADTESIFRQRDSRRITDVGTIPIPTMDAATSTTDDNESNESEPPPLPPKQRRLRIPILKMDAATSTTDDKESNDSEPPPLPPKQRRLRIPWWTLIRKARSKVSVTMTSYDLQDIDEDSLRRHDGCRVFESESNLGEHIIPDVSICSSTTSGADSINDSVVILNPVTEENWTDPSVRLPNEKHNSIVSISSSSTSSSGSESERDVTPENEIDTETSLEDHELRVPQLSALATPSLRKLSERDVRYKSVTLTRNDSIPPPSTKSSQVQPKSSTSDSVNSDSSRIRERAISLSVDTISMSDDTQERPKTPLPISDISRFAMKNASLRRTLTKQELDVLDDFAVTMWRLRDSISRRNARILEQSLSTIKNAMKDDLSTTETSGDTDATNERE